jgi:hypothetical protein
MSAVANQERAVTPRRYSEITGLAPMTVYQHIWAGKVHAKQFLGRWLIYLDSPPQPAKEITQ